MCKVRNDFVCVYIENSGGVFKTAPFFIVIIVCFPTALTVDFNPVSYMLSEGDATQLIVELSFPADRDVSVDVTLNPGTAIGENKNNGSIHCPFFMKYI